MAEFAEESLEKLLPAFEVIKSSNLFSSEEFNAFVQQCSRFEYRLQKRVDPLHIPVSSYLYYLDQVSYGFRAVH